MIDPKPGTYVAGLAAAWAATDPAQRWIYDAPDSPASAEGLTADTIDSDTIADYLTHHNPFPDDSTCEVASRDVTGQWEPAEVIERVGTDEWIVEYPDGFQGFRDTSELRRPA